MQVSTKVYETVSELLEWLRSAQECPHPVGPSPKDSGNGATATSCSLSHWEGVGVREMKHIRVQIVARFEKPPASSQATLTEVKRP
jgi:hypothetical protein